MMKKIWLLLLMLPLCAGCDKAVVVVPDEPSAPEAVVHAIAVKFDSITDLTLTTLKTNDLYAADFKSNQIRYKAIVRQDGSFQNLDVEMPLSSMPSTVQVYITTHFPGGNASYLYQNIDPATNALMGYSLQVSAPSGKYLLAFDRLGARISTIKEPDTDWWRYTVQEYAQLPADIRSVIQAAQPAAVFYQATALVDAQQVSTWQVAVRNSNFLEVYELDAAANLLNHHTEDLYEIEGLNLKLFDFNDSSQLPTIISDFLDSQFTGWTYIRGVFLLDSNNGFAGFLVIISLNQSHYYTRFDATGIFTGANKE